LVRGLDYYCHTAFEITSDQLGAQATVCGGGRYNGLIGQLGGLDTPAVGWALGMERLLLVLEAAAKADPDGDAARLTAVVPPNAYLVNRGEQAETAALILARSLRCAGLVIELDNSGASFSKQFKRADRCGARWALVLGDEEVEKGEVRIKPLSDEGDDFFLGLHDLTGLLAKLNDV
jgi:histidyl-tRNA synthetase